MWAVVSVAAGVLILGCATPSGTYRDYFGFRNTPLERQKLDSLEVAASPVRSSERSTTTYVVVPETYVVVPDWAYADWYAPWQPSVYYCRPVYYRWGYWRYYPWYWYAPPVVVVVPADRVPEPPVRVRTFGPSRGSVESIRAIPVGEGGGGRSRERASSDTASPPSLGLSSDTTSLRGRPRGEESIWAQPVQEPSAQSQRRSEQTSEQGGGRTRSDKAEKATKGDEGVTVRTRSKRDDIKEGGGRSRGKARP
ncbi:MAG: hypothetical protein NZ960_06825 [Candidatus Kapabacteria bacterium]|nr:hypothetical protein [Candidatus Kapabacteria bacterium]MDW8012717.1 hypothetical protein [Bacteroidota bacterium]